MAVTEITQFQEKVYTHLLLIPPGRVTSYAALARTLCTSPRAIGGALRNNPYAPDVPCHRVIASDGFVGGFMGDWQKAPSGINQTKKLRLLAEEGVHFDTEGKLITSTTPTTTHTPFTTAATATTSTTSTATAVKKACRKEAAGAGHVWFDGASSLDSDLDGAQERLKIIMESGKSKKV
ncbi:hypothetical protein LTR99_004174 [Exophiala xenobiotica]|uniref:Methylated-DNA--protein-cysteine methyltransferase n=1 Tax=Vermiconidia calcicola TaxID=1690605 RepID=A0AAV9QM07_9PEZI|nr:hypothetical protein LTR99_004174 [Exophiala xenobiotica]KAK5435643.1 hypothetical protein LTR34_003147 [Exophiala xenobiotica]KAK5538322.1 hypothetical protein LTR23_006947 [Chaetothyriales sp. CCFEE 6169]KAK5545064.1 hypothetical protein LTR25_000071 [Vermiconidia calcicola]